MKKIIISSIVMVLILILGVSTIVLSVIPTGLNNVIEMPNEVTIIYSKTKDLSPQALVYRDRDEEDTKPISNIFSVFSHAFEQKTLAAIFNREIHDTISENHIDSSKYVKNNSSENNKITICFKYSTKKKIKGYEYSYLYFEITNLDERQECVFGVGNSFSVDNDYYYYNYYYSGKANFIRLFNYIEGLV